MGDNLTFSQRHGYEAPRAAQVETMDNRLRNALWNCVYGVMKWNPPHSSRRYMYSFSSSSEAAFYKKIFNEVLGARLDTMPHQEHDIVRSLGQWFQEAPWYRVYDLVQFIVDNGYKSEKFIDKCNAALEREVSGWRILEGKLVPIVSPSELQEVEAALQREGPVTTHLRAAVCAVSDRNNPNPRKVAAESISAVESAVREILGDANVTLGDGLKRLKLGLHPALEKGFGNLYGWAGDAKTGVRHGLSGEPFDVEAAEARYMLVTCSAFVNYLRSKTGKELG